MKKDAKKMQKNLGTWSEINDKSNLVHNDKMIAGFFGEYRFLSNYYYPAKTFFMGHEFPTSENAYQAAKYFVVNGKWGNKLKFFQECSNDESKKYWKGKVLTSAQLKDWHSKRVAIMKNLVELKFHKEINPELCEKLQATKKKNLEERKWWDDTFWGTNQKGKGKNTLGKILMAVRK